MKTRRIKTADQTLIIHPDTGTFRLSASRQPGASLLARMAARFRQGGQTFSSTLKNAEILQPTTTVPFPFGTIQAMIIAFPTSAPGVSLQVEIGLAKDWPFALLRCWLINQGEASIEWDDLSPVIANPGEIIFSATTDPVPAFFSNGWQSWSTSGAYAAGQRQRTSILGRFQNPMVMNPGTPKTTRRGHFSGDMFGVLGDRQSRTGLLAGFLSQKEQFGSLETSLHPRPDLHIRVHGDGVKVPPGTKRITDWLALGFVNLDNDPLRAYLDLSAQAEGLDIKDEAPLTGWCSWYQFYDQVTEKQILDNLASLVKLAPEIPLPLLQIDDGFEASVGDWFDFNERFPNGLKPLAQAIKAAGFTPGLWLAPFILHPGAALVQAHPDWLLRNKRGKPVTAGFVWNRFTLALDLTHPDVLTYAEKVIQTAIEDWGFEYLKLDFLYAAALKGSYQDPTQTRAQVLRHALEKLRDAAGPEIPMLGCGCPLGSGLGVFEAMRIGADVSGHWRPHFPPVSPLLRHEPHMPSVRNALQNILTRAPLHRRWWINDPDCLLVRPDTALTLAEVQSLASAIALTGGSLLLSDDLPNLPESRLDIVRALLPPIGQRAQVLDWFDSEHPTRLRLDLEGPCGAWTLAAHFNWEDHPLVLEWDPANFHLPDNGQWWLRDFWRGMLAQVTPTHHPRVTIPPHGVHAAALRPLNLKQAVYLGSNLHISQGLEVGAMDPVNIRPFNLSLNLNRQADGKIDLFLPWPQPRARMAGQSLKVSALGEKLFRIDIRIRKNTPCEIVVD